MSTQITHLQVCLGVLDAAAESEILVSNTKHSVPTLLGVKRRMKCSLEEAQAAIEQAEREGFVQRANGQDFAQRKGWRW